jgi:hypothetical protein
MLVFFDVIKPYVLPRKPNRGELLSNPLCFRPKAKLLAAGRPEVNTNVKI